MAFSESNGLGVWNLRAINSGRPGPSATLCGMKFGEFGVLEIYVRLRPPAEAILFNKSPKPVPATKTPNLERRSGPALKRSL
jgi:hypothetical protein